MAKKKEKRELTFPKLGTKKKKKKKRNSLLLFSGSDGVSRLPSIRSEKSLTDDLHLFVGFPQKKIWNRYERLDGSGNWAERVPHLDTGIFYRVDFYRLEMEGERGRRRKKSKKMKKKKKTRPRCMANGSYGAAICR